MLENLDDILEHDKKIAAIRTLLEQINDDFYFDDKDGDDKDIRVIGWEEVEMITSLERNLDSLELLSKKRYVKIIQSAISDIKKRCGLQDKNNEEN
jgi:hypothetical protein